jgi:DNA ligase-associated metallophosphoesterase
MTGYAFTLRGEGLIALPAGALHWPSAGVLVVGDLHLGKSGRMARRGGPLLPPYETEATLSRLDAVIEATGPARVICLGDSFDDATAGEELDESHRLWLTRLMAGRDWVWIAGNHDPAPLAIGGAHLASWREGGLVFRHIAEPRAGGEVSAHYHPKARVGGRSRPCFLIDPDRVILPAFGAYTGGLACDHPDLAALMGPGAIAVLTGAQALAVPLHRPAQRAAPPSLTVGPRSPER